MCKSEELTAAEAREFDVCTKKSGPLLFPDQFKTVAGKMVGIVGKQHSDAPALISYSTSKMPGNALFNQRIVNPSFLLEEFEFLLGNGFLEDKDGHELESLILPIDAFDLSADLKGVIVDCDLRNFTNGFTWLLKPSEAPTPDFKNPANILRAIKDFVKTMDHLSQKGYYLRTMDGHQFFFNSKYGVFRFVYDGIDVAQDIEDTCPDMTNSLKSSVSAIIMFLLTGVWTTGKDNGLISPPAADDISVFLDTYDNESVEDITSSDIWNALPSAIQEALFNSCLAQTRIDITLEQWGQILQDAIDDVDECVFCGNDIFKSASQCLCCGKTTKKKDLLTKWSIRTNNQPRYIRLSFGRGTILTGEILGIPSGRSDYMKILYNTKSNMLGIKNLSNIMWHVTKRGAVNELAPGSTATIEKDILLEFDGHPGIEMRFTGYEY